MDIQVVSIPALYSWQWQSKISLWMVILLVELFLLAVSMNERIGSHVISIFSVLVQESESVSHSFRCYSLRPHGLQHARPPCLVLTPRVYSNSCPLLPSSHLIAAIQPSHPLSSPSPPVFHWNVSVSMPAAVVVRVCVCVCVCRCVRESFTTAQH